MNPRSSSRKSARHDAKKADFHDGTSLYLYEQIYGVLKEEILSGKYKKGDWFPPERVLKKRFNTTHLTVRNALAKLVLEGYIERYSGKGTIVLFSRDQVHTSRKPLGFSCAHLVIERLDELGASLLEAFEGRLRRVPLPLRISCHHGDILLGKSICRQSRDAGELTLLEPFGQREPLTDLDGLYADTVVIRSAVNNLPSPQIVIDDPEGGCIAVRNLHELGYKEIALITSEVSSSSESLYRGLFKGLSAVGMSEESGITESCVSGFEGGESAVRSILSRKPECRAFICASDITAAGAMSGLKKEGLIAGQDCAVIGYGDTILARTLRLTSINPRFDLLAERTVDTIRECISRGTFMKEIFFITPELCVRDSSAVGAKRY